MKSWFAALALSVLIPINAQAQSFAPAGWADGLKLNELVDQNPDPNIVEVNLVAKLADVEVAPGKTRARLDL